MFKADPFRKTNVLEPSTLTFPLTFILLFSRFFSCFRQFAEDHADIRTICSTFNLREGRELPGRELSVEAVENRLFVSLSDSCSFDEIDNRV